MPKLAQYIQEPIVLYPVAQELDANHGVLQTPLDKLVGIDPARRITLARLANAHGNYLGPIQPQENEDVILEVGPKDFEYAKPVAIAHGLWIPRKDPRYRSPTTEDLIRVSPKGGPFLTGLVFPNGEWRKVARSPEDLARHAMDQTRLANTNTEDRTEAERRVGASAAHVLDQKDSYMESLKTGLLKRRNTLLAPLYKQTRQRSGKPRFQNQFLAKNLDRKRREFDEVLHDTIETATINLDLNRYAVNGLHRAVNSNLYRRGSSAELIHHWRGYIALVGAYEKARIERLKISQDECRRVRKAYDPFVTEPASA